MAGCVDVVALLRGRANYAVIETARKGRSNLDFGTMPMSQRQRCKMNFAILSQFARYNAERTLFPQEDAAYRSLIDRASAKVTFTPATGRIGGPVVTILDLR